MKAGKIPVVKVSRGGAVGTPEEFEQRFERGRKPKQTEVRRPTLTPVENRTMDQRLEDFGISGQ